MYNLGNVETNHGAVYLEPGIHTVKVSKVDAVRPDGKADRIEMHFESADGTSVQNFYMSEKAEKNSLTNIKHVVAAIAGEEAASAVTGDDLESFAANINAAIAGKECKIKLSGEYYNGTLRGKFAFRPFVTGPKEETLKFNPETDIKKDESASMMEGLAAPGAMPAVPAGAPAGDIQFG